MASAFIVHNPIREWSLSSSQLPNSQGLKGGAADIGGNITPASLYSFVDQSLGAWQQRPVFKTNISRFLPLRTIQANPNST